MPLATSGAGSLFSLGRVSPDALPDLLHMIRHHDVLCTAQRRLGQLLEAWVGRSRCAPESRCTDAHRRRVVIYTLNHSQAAIPPATAHNLFDRQLLNVADADTARREEHDILAQLFRHPNTVTCAPTDPEKTTFKGERLTVFTLAPALNIGRVGAVTSKTTRIWRGTRSFEVTVRSLAGHRIPNVQDLRPFVVAWTLARDQLPLLGEQAPRQPVFVMSLTTICEHLGFAAPTANHRRQTFNRLRRFRSSEWHLTDDRYNVLRTFRTGGVLERDKYMSFISDLEVISSVGGHGKTPEVIAITFHPAFTPVLTDMERSLTLHKEFIQGKHREFDQLIYQWCRTNVQHNHEPQEYALERVHREAHPSVSMVEFRQGLERMADDRRYEQIPNNNCAMILIPGYALKFDFAQDKISAAARSDDRHVGTTSKFALAKLHKRTIDLGRERLQPAERKSTHAVTAREPRGPQHLSDLLERLKHGK